MSNLEEQIIQVVEEFLSDIKMQYPETKTLISRKYKFLKRKIEEIIPDDNVDSQSVEMGYQSDVEMASQVNIYILFYK